MIDNQIRKIRESLCKMLANLQKQS